MQSGGGGGGGPRGVSGRGDAGRGVQRHLQRRAQVGEFDVGLVAPKELYEGQGRGLFWRGVCRAFGVPWVGSSVGWGWGVVGNRDDKALISIRDL